MPDYDLTLNWVTDGDTITATCPYTGRVYVLYYDYTELEWASQIEDIDDNVVQYNGTTYDISGTQGMYQRLTQDCADACDKTLLLPIID